MVNLRRIGRTLFRADLRAAFFRSLRGVIGPRGQLGSFLEMEYLAAHLPTLLVWSQRDVIIPVAHAHRTHEHLPGSELVVLPRRRARAAPAQRATSSPTRSPRSFSPSETDDP